MHYDAYESGRYYAHVPAIFWNSAVLWVSVGVIEGYKYAMWFTISKSRAGELAAWWWKYELPTIVKPMIRPK